MRSMRTHLLILGSGPAGLTAAVYAARSNLRPIALAGSQAGGQLMLTTDVENYPGFPDAILGPELIEKMRSQAERFGAKFIDDDAESVDFKRRPLVVRTPADLYEADSVIIATGSAAKWLGLESEQRLIGRGVSSCAVCDAPFFKDRIAVVVGGGDTAMEESLTLTKFARAVTIVHRRDKLRASKIMQDRALKNTKIGFIWDAVVDEVLGRESVTGVMIRNLKTNEISRLDCDAVFIAIGHEPKTEIFKGEIELDERGYIVTSNEVATPVPGVFAAGDVVDHRYRQVATCVGSGCKAALEAEKYLEAL